MQLRVAALTLIPIIAILLIGEGVRTMAKPLKTINSSIPPIDRDVTEKRETATFALG
jgi:hypothetical protein